MHLLASARKQVRWLVGGVGVAIAVVVVPLAIVFLSTSDTQVQPDKVVGSTAPVDPRVIPPLQAPLTEPSTQHKGVPVLAPSAADKQADHGKSAPASDADQTSADQAFGQPSNVGRSTGAPLTKEQLTVEDSVAVSVAEHGAGPDADSQPAEPEKTAASLREDPATGESSKDGSVATSEPQGQGGLTEGIGMRTSGFIEVRDPDGTLVSRQEFK